MGVFRHGVASGDPLADRVVIWTRATVDDGTSIDVDWSVATDPELMRIVASGTTTATAATDHTAKVDVSGLEAARSYWYAFHAAGQRSIVGRTRTLAAGPVERTRFVQCSCSKYNAGFFNAYAGIAARADIDFVLHLGDYIYEASQTPPATQTPGADIGRPFDPPHECVTLDDYRRRYAQYHADPDAIAMHAAHPVVATIDDHEIADGAWRGGADEHRPERDGAWAERRLAALQARWEWMPLRMPDPADPSRIYRSFSLGDLVDIYLIDTRSRRDRPARGDRAAAPSRSQLGHDQAEWLLTGLASSRAAWQVIANGSVMSQMWRDGIPSSVVPAMLSMKLIHRDGDGPDPDQWDGYPAERARILDAIRRSPGSAVILSGDIHAAVAAELSADPFGSAPEPVAVEFVTTSLTSQNLDDKMGWAPRTASLPIERRLLSRWPHVRWCDLDSHGYVIIDIDRERVMAEWWFVDTVLRRSDGEALGARWAVERGRSRLDAVDTAEIQR